MSRYRVSFCVTWKLNILLAFGTKFNSVPSSCFLFLILSTFVKLNLLFGWPGMNCLLDSPPFIQIRSMHLYGTLSRLACLFSYSLCDLLLFLNLICILDSMWQDPVKYPDNMSSNFKSFLKGLLNKVINEILSANHI